MPEKQRMPENIESTEPTPRPNLLDVVKIDGHWAQVVGGGKLLLYLDDKSTESIDWNDFKFTKDWKGLPVSFVRESVDFTEKELKRIHWGPEQKYNPSLREEVSVFGEFEKKPSKRRDK